jgi:hypothetical protein
MIKVDIYAKDSIEKVYDVEIQREDRGHVLKRQRVYVQYDGRKEK